MNKINKLKYELSDNRVIILFFLSLAIIGVFNFKSYGIAWQEPGLRYNAGISLIYIAKIFIPNMVPTGIKNFPPLELNIIRDHGVSLDLIYLIIEKFLGITDSQQIYYLIHLLNFTVFFTGVFTIYCLVSRRLKSKNLGLVASIFFVLSPRIFADSNYLSADMGFTVFLLIATHLSLRYIASPSIRLAILTGVATGFATGIRIQGIGLFFIVLLAFLFKFTFDKQILKELLKSLVYYVAFTLFSLYMFFPYLWEDPVGRFIEVFSSLSKYNWGGSVLYNGNFIGASDLPWHYSFVWILITTPILYTVFFFYGIFNLATSYKKNFRLTSDLIEDCVIGIMFFGPILSVILLNSVIYDGWRHLYFVYPYFIYFSVVGFSKLIIPNAKLRILSFTAKIFSSLFIIYIALWMFVNNPMQNLYFNFLAGSNNVKNWEMDYLGLGNRNSLEYILANDQKYLISVGVLSFTPLDMSVRILDTKYRNRFTFIEPNEKPDYLFNNFRGVVFSEYSKYLKDYRLFHSFESQGSKYIEIWKLNTK